MMEPNDRCYDVVDMAEAHERHEQGVTMKNPCPCCGTEMVTKLACPIGCPGPESGTKWKRNRGVYRAARQHNADVLAAKVLYLEDKVAGLQAQRGDIVTRAKEMQHCLVMAATGAASIDNTAFAALLLKAAGEPIP
jgi:hypothetical protein